MGFFEGEGCFINSPRKASKSDNRYFPRFQITITQKETDILYEIKQYLKIKGINSYVSPTSNASFLRIEDKLSLLKTCIFFLNQEFHTTTKKKQFDKFMAEIFVWLSSGYKPSKEEYTRQFNLVKALFEPKNSSKNTRVASIMGDSGKKE